MRRADRCHAPTVSAPRSPAAAQYATSRLSPGSSSRATTTASRTRACSASRASISPSSIRKPRIFTCWSFRPRNSMFPSGSYRPRSPVRYIRRSGCSRERIPHKPLRRQLRTVQIPTRHSRSSDIDLSHHSHRHRLSASHPARRSACSRSAARSACCARPSAASARPTAVTSTVASVGPYRLCNRRLRQPLPAPLRQRRRQRLTAAHDTDRKLAHRPGSALLQQASAASTARSARRDAVSRRCISTQISRVPMPFRPRQHQPRPAATVARKTPTPIHQS